MSTEITQTAYKLIINKGTVEQGLKVANALTEAARAANLDDRVTLFDSVYGSAAGFGESTDAWLNHHRDCLTVSKDHPGVVFTINGMEDSRGDVWAKAYKDGHQIWGWELDMFHIPHIPEKLITSEKDAVMAAASLADDNDNSPSM